jgi:hypothetical protein
MTIQQNRLLYADREDGLARTIVADTIQSPASIRLGRDVDVLSLFQGVKRADCPGYIPFEPVPEDLQYCSELYLKYVSTLGLKFRNGARLFLTSAGHLGLSQQSHCKRGDLVVIMPGSTIPCILRPVQESPSQELYEYVCEAYVHGIMDGQFMTRDPVVRTYTII